MPELLLEIRTRKRTHNWSFGQQLMGTIVSFDDRLVPESLLGHSTLHNIPYDGVESCEDWWARPFSLKIADGPWQTQGWWEFGWRRRRVVKLVP